MFIRCWDPWILGERRSVFLTLCNGHTGGNAARLLQLHKKATGVLSYVQMLTDHLTLIRTITLLTSSMY